ncbi:MAG TPA: magnesium transporter, partial [Gemmatimonadaceae bacterium]|nr:magnesium transporter [Gemmatimonadaceae bacterium]
MTPPQRDEERPLAALLVPDLLVLLEEEPASVGVETEEMHPRDLADVVEAMPEERVAELLAALPAERAAEVMEYLDERLRTSVLEQMTAHEAATIVVEMTPDDRADVLDELAEETAEEILLAIPAEERLITERLLAYEPDTAGGLMTTDFLSVPEDITVDDALLRVRALAREGRQETIYSIYVTDHEGRLAGVMSLRELLGAPEGTLVSDVAWEEVVSVNAEADQAEVARLTAEYDIIAVPVVDDEHRLLGLVTVDDVIDAIEEEATEDVQKLGGMEALEEPYLDIGFLGIIRKRVVWLCVLFLGSLLTATVIGRFTGALDKAIVLSLFIPLIISSGGNSGSQATSLIIRAMALEEVTLADWWRVARRELASGLVLGAVLGVLGFLRIIVWHYMDWTPTPYVYPWRLAFTIGFALVGVVTFGSLAGSMLPFALRRLGLDPASASAPFVATLVDVTGLMIYFG